MAVASSIAKRQREPASVKRRGRAYLALVDQLYKNQLFERFHLNGRSGRAWTTCTYLEELACFSPAFEPSVRHTPSIMIHQVVVVVQVRNRSIYYCDWVGENGKCRGEMSCRYAHLTSLCWMKVGDRWSVRLTLRKME